MRFLVLARTSFTTILACYVLLCACGPSSTFDGNDGNEVRPPASIAGGIDLADQRAINKPIFRAEYRVTVEGIRNSRKHRSLCEGDSKLTANSDYSIQMEGILNCTRFGIDVDLSELVAGEIEGLADEIAKELPHYGVIKRVKRQGVSTYFPSFPNLLGPVIQRPEEYDDFFYRESFTVRQENEDKQLRQDEGWVEIRALSFGPLNLDTFPQPFDRVLHWERTVVSGFEGINRSQGFLFDKSEYWWNLKPIMIPRIRITAPFNNFLEDSKLRRFGDRRGIIIDFKIKSHEIL